MPTMGCRPLCRLEACFTDIFEHNMELVAAVVPASGDVPLPQFLARGFRERIGKLRKICRHD